MDNKPQSKKKILICLASLGLAGVETFTVNLFRYLDKDIFEVHFLITPIEPKDEYYSAEITKLGGIIHRCDKHKIKNRFKRVKYLEKCVRELVEKEHFCCVHVMLNSSLLYVEAKAARKGGCQNIIIHSHCAYASTSSLLSHFFKGQARKYADHYFACGIDAGKWVFGKKFERYSQSKVINNGFNVSRFKFSQEKQSSLRKEYGISENDFVIGMVSRLSDVKNHIFMLNVINELQNKKNVKLVIVGDGPEKENIISFINENNLQNVVMLLGLKNNIYDILSLFDVYALPSKFEGLPTSAIEAQANGLVCLISDKVDLKTQLIDDVRFLPIDSGSEEWIKALDEIRKNPKSVQQRIDDNQTIIDKGYDMNGVVKYIESVYLGE